ncbi:MAG: T9SS type A sorting domain-containing protein, partial [Bacteroidia bacterium]
TNSTPIGLEVQAQAFAFSTNSEAINNATFFQYKIINRSSSTLTETYFGHWADPDLGNATDDYVGCDVTRGMGYCYNADANDDLPAGYGLNPPTIGIDFLEGPLADPNDGIDNDRDGTTDEPGEQIIMSKFLYYNNVNGAPDGNPDGFAHFYNYLRGIWGDGLPMTHTCNGRDPGALANFMYPGTTDPDNPTNLTEASCGNPAGDRRFLESAGTFTLMPGAVNFITASVIWARDTINGSSLDSLKTADDIIQQFYDSCYEFTVSINEIEGNNCNLTISPNPFSLQTLIQFNCLTNDEFKFTLFDVNGKIVRKIEKITSNQITLKKENLESGIYFFKLENSKGKFTAGKLVVE